MARQKNSSRRRRRGRFTFLYKVLSLLVVCVAISLALTLFFRVNAVEVSGQARYSDQQIVTASGIVDGDNMFLMNKYEVAQQIITQLPYVEELRIHRRLPDTLLIEVRECRKPVALHQEDTVWHISPSGKIVGVDEGTEETMPVLTGCTAVGPSVGSQLVLDSDSSPRRGELFALLQELEESNMLDQVNGISMEDTEVIAFDYMGRFRVEMNYGTDYAYKLKTLRAILEDSGKIQDNMTGTFDMRREDGKTNFIPTTQGLK